MPIEMLSYAELGERLKISPEAARALVKRHRLPRSRSNSGKTLVQVDLTEINHSPVARAATPSAGHQVVAALNEHIATLQAELLDMKAIAGGHRADFERESDRSNRLIAELNSLMAELMKAGNETTAAREKAAYFAGKLATAEQSMTKKQPWWRPKPSAPVSTSLSEKHRTGHSIPVSAAALIMVALLSWGVVTGLNSYLGPVEHTVLVTGSLPQ
jgi:septal ring factor EnvC (AmiA/AmiB activator)